MIRYNFHPIHFITRSRLSYTGRPSGYSFCSNALFRSLCIRLPAVLLPLNIVVYQVQFPSYKFYYPVPALLHRSTLGVSFCSNALFRSLCIRLPALPLPHNIVVYQVQFLSFKFLLPGPGSLTPVDPRGIVLFKCLVQIHTYLAQSTWLPSLLSGTSIP